VTPLSPRQLDFAGLIRTSEDFRVRLERLKAELRPAEFAWYPYDTVGNLRHLDHLLTGQCRFLLELAGDAPVLDVGCGDGDLSFWLESLGCQAHALDLPRTNSNGMQGVRRLKTALGSAVEIWEVDLDAHFVLPPVHYGLVFMLGVLYHLKNPFYVLETLATATRYCLLSTVITSLAPDGRTRLGNLPLAYLLDEQEINDDPSNYWVFTEAGLRRLLTRTRWEICDWMVVQPEVGRRAAFWERRERAFCLLRSQVAEPGATARLLGGWHALEEWTWRWTERRFSAALRAPARSGPAVLTLSFVLPEVVIERLGPVTLSATLAGRPLTPETYDHSGELVYRREVAVKGLEKEDAVVEFELDKALPPDATDGRERGLIAVSLRWE
jgi:hypothetical protein